MTNQTYVPVLADEEVQRILGIGTGPSQRLADAHAIVQATMRKLAGQGPVAHRIPKAGVNNGHHFIEGLGKDEIERAPWEPLYARPMPTVAGDAVLRKALEQIVSDTTDAFPPYRSLGASGPVKDVARKALAAVPSPPAPQRSDQ